MTSTYRRATLAAVLGVRDQRARRGSDVVEIFPKHVDGVAMIVDDEDHQAIQRARRCRSAHGQDRDSFWETLSRAARASRSQSVIEPMYRLTASLPSANVG